MTTDNTQAELRELILKQLSSPLRPEDRADVIMRAITAYTNKQIEEVLDRLATQRGILSDPVHGEKSIPVSAIEAERNKLKESK